MRHFSRELPAWLSKWEGSPAPGPSYLQQVLCSHVLPKGTVPHSSAPGWCLCT